MYHVNDSDRHIISKRCIKYYETITLCFIFDGQNNYNMAKNSKSTPANTKKILREDLAFWSKKWKVSSLQIGGAKRAVQSESVSKVEKYLRKKGLIK
jgi:hypothetical protein